LGKINSFEELECWKSAHDLLILVYKTMDKTELKKEFSFQDQIKRATLSISNNIAEGFERTSTKETIRFLVIANSSASEVKNMIIAAYSLNFIDQIEYTSLFESCIKTQKLTKGFIRYLNNLHS
jgi:four helix bundle protein